MPKPAKGARLGSGPAHEKLLLSGLAADLFREERIRTTEAKAKRLRPVAEKLITMGKSATVHSRRQALSAIEDRDVIHKLFSDIGPRFAERQGGYTRILKLGPRQGDAAPMAIIELLEGSVEEQDSAQPESRKRRLRRRRAGGKGVSRAPIESEADEAESADQAEDGASEVAPPTADATADTPSAGVEAPAVAEAEAKTPVAEAESPAEPEEAAPAETASKDEA